MDDELTKQQLKEKRIREALEEIVGGDTPLVQTELVEAHIHSELHDNDFFDEDNFVTGTIPTHGEIKTFLSETDELAFAKIVDAKPPNTWLLQGACDGDAE